MYCYDLEQRATELNNLHQNLQINSVLGGSRLCQANEPKKKTLKDFTAAASEMLHRKYDTQFQFYFARPVNELLQNMQTPAVVQFKEWYFIDDSYEYLKRFYKKTEQNQRIVQLVALYQKLLPPFSPAFFCKTLGPLMLERRREIAILFVKTVYHKKQQHQQSTKPTEQESHQNDEHLLDMLDETSLLAESIQSFSIRERTKSKHIGNVPKQELKKQNENHKNKDKNYNELIKIQEHGQYETTEISSPRRRERISPSKQKSDNMLKLSAQKLSASPEKTERTRRVARETERRGGQDIIQNKQKSAEKQDGCKLEIRRARSNQLNEQSAGIFAKRQDGKMISGTNEKSRDNLPDKLIDSRDKNRNLNTVNENETNNNDCIQLGSFVQELAKAEENSKNNSLESASYDIFNPSFSGDGLVPQCSDSLDNLNEQLLASRLFQTNISDSVAEKYILILSQTSGKIQNSQSQHVPSQAYINGENSMCNIWGMSSQRNSDWMKIKQSLEMNNRSISTGHVSSRFDHTGGDNRTSSQVDNSQNFLSPTEYLLDRYLMGSSSTKQEHNNTDFDEPNGDQELERQQHHYLVNTQEQNDQLDQDQSSSSKRTAVELKLLGRIETKKWDESQLKQEQRAFWSQWEKLKQDLPKNHKLTQQIAQSNEIKTSNSNNTNSQPQLNSYNSLFSSSAGIAGEINSQTASCSNKTTTSSNKTASSYHQMSTSSKSLIPNKLTPTTPTNQQQIYQQISANAAYNSQCISAPSSSVQNPLFINKIQLNPQNSNENEGQNTHDKKELNNNNSNANGNPSTPLNYLEDNIDDRGYSPKIFSLKLHPIQCDDHFNVDDDRRQSSMPDLNEYGQKSKNMHRMQLQQFSQHSCLQKQQSNGQSQFIGKNQSNNSANRQTQPNMMVMMNQGILNSSKSLSKSAVSQQLQQQQQQQQQQSRHFLTNFVKSANQMHSSQIVKSPSVYIPSNQSNLTVSQRTHNPTSKSIHIANTNNNSSNNQHNNSNISKIPKILPKTKKPNSNKSNTFISAFAECLASEQQSLISSSSASPNLMCLSTPSPCLTAQHLSAPSPTSATGMTLSRYPTLQQSNSTPESNNPMVRSTENISNKSTSNLRHSIEESRPSMNQQNSPLMSHYFSTANLFFKQSSPSSSNNDTAKRVQQLQQQSEQGKQQQKQLTSKFQQLSQLRLSIEGNFQNNSNSQQNKPNDAATGIVQSQSLHVAAEPSNISRPKISGTNAAVPITTASPPGMKSSRDYYQLSRKESKSSTSSCLLGSAMIPKNINTVITKLSTPHQHHRATHSVKDSQGIMMLSEEQQTPAKQQHQRQQSLYRQTHNKQSNSCVSLEELGGEIDQQQQFNSSNNSYGFLTSRSSGRKITEKAPLANCSTSSKTYRSNINESPYHLSAVESFNKHKLKIKQAEQNERKLKQQQQNQIGNEQNGCVTENDCKMNLAITQRKSSAVVPTSDARLTFKRYSHDIVQSSCSGLSQKLFGKQVQEKEQQNQVKQPQQGYQSQNTLEKQQEMCQEQLGGQQMEDNMQQFQQEQRQMQIYQELIQHIKNSNSNNKSNRHSYQLQKQQQQQQQQNTKMNKKI